MPGVTMSNELRARLADMATACRILSMEGHEDGTQGHLSLRDPEGRGLWLKRMGVPLGRIMGPEDFILIDFDGNQLAGDGRRHAEWPIHTEIMRARPEVNVVGHSHPHFATLFSAVEAEFEPIVQAGHRVRGHKVARYEDTSVLILDSEMGADLARSMDGHWAVFLRNHGITFAGEDIAGAALTAIYLEHACRALFEVHASGLPYKVPPKEELAEQDRIFQSEWFLADNWSYFVDRLATGERGS